MDKTTRLTHSHSQGQSWPWPQGGQSARQGGVSGACRCCARQGSLARPGSQGRQDTGQGCTEGPGGSQGCQGTRPWPQQGAQRTREEGSLFGVVVCDWLAHAGCRGQLARARRPRRGLGPPSARRSGRLRPSTQTSSHAMRKDMGKRADRWRSHSACLKGVTF